MHPLCTPVSLFTLIFITKFHYYFFFVLFLSVLVVSSESCLNLYSHYNTEWKNAYRRVFLYLVKRKNKRTVPVVPLMQRSFTELKNFSQHEKVQFKSTYPLFNVTLIFQWIKKNLTCWVQRKLKKLVRILFVGVCIMIHAMFKLIDFIDLWA